MRTTRIAATIAIAALLATGCSNEEPPVSASPATEATVDTAPSDTAGEDVVNDQPSDTQAKAPTTPNYTIDMNNDKWLRGLVELTDGNTVVIRNYKEGELLEMYGYGFDVYIEGNLPAGATLSIMGPNATVNVSGDIEQGANLTIQGDAATVNVEGDIAQLAIVNLYSADGTVKQNGKVADASLIDSSGMG